MNKNCCTSTRVSRVKVEEKGKQAIFLNQERVQFTKVRFDGCVVTNATACDWVVIRADAENILVELKGTDVEHAIFQIEAAFAYLDAAGLLLARNAALIVCSRPPRHPSFTSKLQKARSRLSQRYKAPLHVVSGNYEYEVDNVMRQTGPF